MPLPHSADRLLAAIVESSDDAIVAKDLQGTILSWNSAAARIFGYSAEEAIGRSILLIVPEDRHAEEEEVLRRVRAGSGVSHYETVRRRKDGTLIDISLTVSPIRDANGTIVGASKIARDITEARRLARQLDEAARLKDEFLATLSHELRTPLNAITGYVRMLRRGMLAGDHRERALEIVERNAKALTTLVADLLDVSAIVTGKLRLRVEPVDLGRIVAEALESVRPAVDAKGLRVELSVDREAGPVRGDAERLQQVCWNLLTNAVKFTPRGGRITVRLAAIDSQIELSVADSGIGIPEAFLPHVFERFRQADGRTTREFGGLGVGLAIVRHLVELHGGTVHVESGGANRGATFRIRLPLLSDRPAAPPADGMPVDATHPLRLAGVRVLAVDDDPDSLALVGDILRMAGATVETADSAAAALDALADTPPDVLLVDLGMPGIDGYEFIRIVRADRGLASGVPAAALTAFARSEDRTRSLLAGFQMHLMKPIDPAELTAAVAALAKLPHTIGRG